MLTHEDLMTALSTVIDPELGRNIVELGMVRDLTFSSEGVVAFTLSLTIPTCPLKNRMKQDAEKALLAVHGVKAVEITFGAMTPEEREAVLGKANPELPKLGTFNKIGQVIAVMSGKGGVGKSTLTALLAVELSRRGQKVGILDADITGPSIPKLFGLPSGGLRGSEQGILPAITPGGIRVVSTNLLLPEESKAIIWRGPLISGAIQQFFKDVLWGKLDTLLIDLPPGTADAAITVLSNLPLDGVILVTSPQQLATMVVSKALDMLQNLNIPVHELVENYSYFNCPACGATHAIFGPSNADNLAAQAGVKNITRLPIQSELTALGDAGQIEKARLAELDPLVERLLCPETA
jgi:Mrp family chromosome partitioning ATPase